MKRWLKAELHTHTDDDPVDGGREVMYSARELIDLAGEKRFEVLSITNHDQQLCSAALMEYAAERGILLIPGVEATLKGKHVLLYNFPGYRSSWDDPLLVQQQKGPDQLVIAPHPYFPTPASLGRKMIKWDPLFDAVEYCHFYLAWLNFNRRAVRTARRLSLPLVGNSDVHRLDQLGCTYTLIYAEKNVASVLEAVKAGDVRLVTQPVSALFVAKWLAGNLAGRSRYALRTVLSWCGLDRKPDPLGSTKAKSV